MYFFRFAHFFFYLKPPLLKSCASRASSFPSGVAAALYLRSHVCVSVCVCVVMDTVNHPTQHTQSTP
jgi:hypothetical protein